MDNMTDDQASNRQFITEMIEEGKTLGIKAGIKTDINSWNTKVGHDWSYPADQGLPLWYVHEDGVASFDDFEPFGGWTHPAVKHYGSTYSDCGADIGLNYYE